MRGGALRTQISIERQVQVGVTDLNAPNMVWQEWRTPFAELTVRRGKEHFDPQTRQRYGEDVWLFRTRYVEIEGIDSKMRVVHDGKNFDIRSIRPDAQRLSDAIVECTVQNAVMGSAALSIAITVAIPDGEAGVAYGGFTVEASGGTAPYTFVEESGTLPQGLSINASTGAVTGTPLSAGTFTIDIQVTDAAGTIAALPSFDIVIA